MNNVVAVDVVELGRVAELRCSGVQLLILLVLFLLLFNIFVHPRISKWWIEKIQ